MPVTGGFVVAAHDGKYGMFICKMSNLEAQPVDHMIPSYSALLIYQVGHARRIPFVDEHKAIGKAGRQLCRFGAVSIKLIKQKHSQCVRSESICFAYSFYTISRGNNLIRVQKKKNKKTKKEKESL